MGAVTRGEGYNHVHVVTQNKEKAEAEKFKGAEERKNKRQAKQVNLIAVGAASTLQDRLQGLCGDGGWTPENLCKKFKVDELKALIGVPFRLSDFKRLGQHKAQMRWLSCT